MAYQSAWGSGSPAYGPGGEWASRPRYTPADFVTLLWRDRFLMLGVFAVLFLIGVVVALLLKPEYPARSSILIRLGQEYVYEPSVGDAARGAIPTTDQLVQSETEILSSVELKRRVVDALGYGRLFPDKASVYADAAPDLQHKMLDAATTAMAAKLKVEAAPDTPVVRLTYSDTDAVRAAQVLNKLLDEYLIYRRSVLLDGSEPYLEDQLKVFERQLADTDAAYQGFMTSNGIDDFDAEKSSLNSLQTSLTDENYRVQARMKEIEGRLGEIGRQVGRISPVIDLYHDSNPATTDKLLQLQIDRQDLLSRYKPDAQPVKDIDQRIGQIQALVSQGGGQASGAKRSGVNPVYQTVQTDQVQLGAEQASLHERQEALVEQLAQISARRQKLTELEPRYVELSRNRDLLRDEVRALVQKQQESQASQSIARNSNDNIRIVERPTPPTASKSLRKPVLILAFLFAAFTAFCVGLLRVFLLRGLATPASASRTLELPVLATVGFKP